MEERPQARRQLHAYVSDEARAGWYSYAAANGTSVTALLEALGLVLAGGLSGDKPGSAFMRKVAADARDIASSRSSRARE